MGGRLCHFWRDAQTKATTPKPHVEPYADTAGTEPGFSQLASRFLPRQVQHVGLCQLVSIEGGPSRGDVEGGAVEKPSEREPTHGHDKTRSPGCFLPASGYLL